MGKGDLGREKTLFEAFFFLTLSSLDQAFIGCEYQTNKQTVFVGFIKGSIR